MSELITTHEQQIARLFEITREIIYAEKRRKGTALFFLPDENGQPTGEAVAMSSGVMRAWIVKRYEDTHGEAPVKQALDSFIKKVVFDAYFPATKREREN